VFEDEFEQIHLFFDRFLDNYVLLDPKNLLPVKNLSQTHQNGAWLECRKIISGWPLSQRLQRLRTFRRGSDSMARTQLWGSKSFEIRLQNFQPWNRSRERTRHWSLNKKLCWLKLL